MSFNYSQKRWWLLTAFLLFLSISVFACAEPMQEGRGVPGGQFVTPNQRDLGKELYRMMLREAAIHPTRSKDRVQAVQQLNDKWNIPLTINLLLPVSQIQPFEAFMRSLLEFYDDDTIPHLTKEVGALLQYVSNQKPFLTALEAFQKREGLMPPIRIGDDGLYAHLLEFEHKQDWFVAISEWWLQQDGKKPTTSNSSDSTTKMTDLLKALGQQILKTETDFDFASTREFLFFEDSRLDLFIGRHCIAQFDKEGNPIPVSNQQYSPNDPPPFPTDGRTQLGPCKEAVDVNKTRLYKMHDLSQSIFGAVFIEFRKMIQQSVPLQGDTIPFPFNMLAGVRPLLGPPQRQGGFAEKNPVTRALEALVEWAKGPNFAQVVRFARHLLDKEEHRLASMFSLVDELSDLTKKHPNQLANLQNLGEDLLVFAQEIIHTPGMFEDLLRVFNKPGYLKAFANSITKLAEYQFKPLTVNEYKYFLQGQPDIIFDQRVDHNAPDNNGNISYFQHVLHLMKDFNGHRYYSRFKALLGITVPSIKMRVDDMGVMFLKSIAGELSIWETIYDGDKPVTSNFFRSNLVNAFPLMGLSLNPNPEQLAVFTNRPRMKFYGIPFKIPILGTIRTDITLADIYCSEKYIARDHNAPVLFAALASNLIARDGGTLSPIAKVFHDHAKLKRLLELLVTLHKHWSSPHNSRKSKNGTSSYPVARTDIRSAIPFIVNAIEQTNMLTQVEDFLGLLFDTQLQGLNQSDRAIDVIRNYLGYILGPIRTPMSHTLIGKFIDASNAMKATLEGPNQKVANQAWSDASKVINDIFLQVEGKGKQARFKNRRGFAIVSLIMERMVKNMDSSMKAGKWDADLQDFQKQTKETLTSASFSKTLDVIDSFVQDRKLLGMTMDLLAHAIPNPETHPQLFGELLSLSASLLVPFPPEIAKPITKFAVNLLVERNLLIQQSINFFNRIIPNEQKEQFTKLFERGVNFHPIQKDSYAFSLFWYLAQAMYRKQPTSTAKATMDDHIDIFKGLSNYMTDPKSGILPLYDVIKRRNGPLPQKP